MSSAYRHLRDLRLRYARWDYSFIHLVDKKADTELSRIFLLDRQRNADRRRRRIGNDSNSAARARNVDTSRKKALPPLLEELFFRGFLITELLALVPLNRALALSSFLFAGIHMVYWLTQGATTQSIVTNAGACFVFSLLAGWLFAKTSSIWPPTCAHIANNLLSSVLAARSV